ncbi:hypothetical protein AABM26_09320 [Curtobacterium aetherium]
MTDHLDSEQDTRPTLVHPDRAGDVRAAVPPPATATSRHGSGRA